VPELKRWDIGYAFPLRIQGTGKGGGEMTVINVCHMFKKAKENYLWYINIFIDRRIILNDR
jgi:hypothetical protein